MSEAGWTRLRGRADYTGWGLHIQGDVAEMKSGLPLSLCLALWLLWKLSLVKHINMVGQISDITFYRKRS